MRSGTRRWGGGVRSVGQKKNFGPLKFFGHLPPLTPRRVEITTGSQKKCKFCAISHLIWRTQSKSVKSWIFLGEIVINLIPLPFSLRIKTGAPKTRKSQRHCALGRVMSQKGKSTCNITIYGRRWGWGVKLRGQKKFTDPG